MSEEPLPDLGLPADVIMAVGCMMVQWGYLESTLNGHIQLFLADPKGFAHRPRARRLTFAKRLALYRKLSRVFYEGDALETAMTACKYIAAIKEEREWIAHGQIAGHDGHLFAVKWDDVMNSDSANDESRSVDAHRLVLAARLMDAARLCMIRAFASVMRQLAPLPLPERDAPP